jgi:MFS family permease
MALDSPLIKRRDFLNQWSFWGLVLIFGIQTGMFQGISIHLFPHLTDIGYSEQSTALALSLMATFAMLSKPVFGWMVDRLPPRAGVIISIASEVAALLLFLIATDYALILLAAVLFGFGYGAMNPLRNGLTAMLFGGRNFGSVAGTMRPFMLPLGIAGLPLGGMVFDTFQNYDLMFVSFILFYLVSLLGLIPIRTVLKAGQ